MITTEDIPGHIIETIDITTEVLHNALTPVLIIPTIMVGMISTHSTLQIIFTQELINLLSGLEQITISFNIQTK